jgi:hypothetical protein
VIKTFDATSMTDMAAEEQPGGERQPASETEPEATPGPPPAEDPSGQPDPPAVDDDASGSVAEDMPVPTAAELTESVKARRQMRQAGLENLKGTWFGGTARFGGPVAFGGNSAGRDVNNYYYRAAERSLPETGPIDPELVTKISSVYVCSSSYAGAERRLRKDRLVVLRGPDGSGRRATGLVLLNELAGHDVNALSADTVLGSPDDSGFRTGAGYLAELPAASDLPYPRLAAWTAELERTATYLVITAPAGADAGDRFVVDHDPPDCREVALRHLRADPAHRDEAERLIASNPAAIACATSPAAAAELANRVLEIVADSRPASDLAPLIAAIRRQCARFLLRSDRPQAIRDRVGLLCRRAVLVSSAAFAGLPFADAVAAAELLANRFIAIEFPDPRDAGRDVFARWGEQLGREPGIVVEESTMTGRWGDAPTAQLRFRDPELHLAMLEEMWEHYDAARSPLLHWLADRAVSSSDEAVRVRAAQIIGRLAMRDFGHICHRLILDLANSISPRAWEAAATALEAAAFDSRQQVRTLLAEWCREGNQHRQRTAILALGTTIGEHNTDWTLLQFRNLALRATGRAAQPIAEAVRRSVTELLSGPSQQTVVHTLRQWAGHADPRLSGVARRCVAPLAHVTDNSGHPLLLLKLPASPVLGEDVVALLAAALAATDTRQETWTALEKLATAAAPSSAMTDSLGKLLADLSRVSAVAADQLFFYLRLWAHRHAELTG